MHVLAGDIGGTKVLLQWAEVERGKYRALAEHRFESAAYDGLLPMVREFQQRFDVSHVDAACMAVAGPIEDEGRRARLTNLPWLVDSQALAGVLGLKRVRLINDFQAVACSIEVLQEKDLVVLQQGQPEPRANRGVIGAGTGFGHGFLVWNGERYETMASEGGHVDFAPTDEAQVELWRYLRAKYGRVSYERVVSGPGLFDLYMFHRDRGLASNLRFENEDAAPAIVSDAALSGEDAAAVAALNMFVAVYGAQAGNVALNCVALGGVYVAGGIAPKILPALRGGRFIESFVAKGRHAKLLQRIPLYVVINERAGVIGAAVAASRDAESPR